METKIYKIMKWVKSYETIGKIQFLLGVVLPHCTCQFWKSKRRLV